MTRNLVMTRMPTNLRSPIHPKPPTTSAVNRQPIPVHSVGIANLDAERVLTKLADDSGGRYLFVADPLVPRPR